MEGGADVVTESRQSEFLGACTPTDRLAGLENHHAVPVLGHQHRRCQAVGSRPDHYGVVGVSPQLAVPSVVPEGPAPSGANRRIR